MTPNYPELAAATRVLRILEALDAPTRQAALKIISAVGERLQFRQNDEQLLRERGVSVGGTQTSEVIK